MNDKIESIPVESNDSYVTGIKTGFTEFDRMTGGLRPGDLILLGSCHAMGKTSFICNIAWHACIRTGIPTAFFNFDAETPGEWLLVRLLRSEYGDDAQKTIKQDAQSKLNNAPLFIYNIDDSKITDIQEKCKLLKSNHDLGLVIIDYLQLMHDKNYSHKDIDAFLRQVSDGDLPFSDRCAIENVEIMHKLAELSKEINVPIIIATQLSRKLEARENRRPMLSDMRHWSEGMDPDDVCEADAAVVVFLYRDEHYNPDTQKKSIAEVIIAKNRHGPVGTVELVFDSEIGKFSNIDKE